MRANGGEPRLEWNPEDERLRLQITHHPPAQEPAGWLALFAATCPDGVFTNPEDRGLLSTMDMGLELLVPAAAASDRETEHSSTQRWTGARHMFEYHCWAVLPDFGDREAEHRLGQELRALIAELDDGARESFHVTNLNTLLVTASGLRNHSQPLVLGVFQWVAEQWPGSYGLMYVASEFPDPDGHWRFHVQKIGNGKIEYLQDRYFEIQG